MAPFTAFELTPVDKGRARLGVSALLALSGPALPERVTPTKVGLTGADHESRTRWIHVAPPGEWRGHGEGAFELAREHFESIKSTLDRKSTPCSLDYEHASIRPKGAPTPAAGYVQATHVRDDGLWACVEFTAEAWDLISSGKYRFCSGVFDFASVDAVTGEPVLCTLDTIALTNRPFIDGQHPIALSRATSALVPLSAGAPKMKIQKKALDKLMDALGLSKEFTAAQLTKALEFLTAGEDAPEEVAAEVADATKADASKPTADKVAASADVAPASADKPADSAECAPPADATATADDLPTDAPVPADPLAKLAEAVGVDAAGLAEKIMANFDAIVSLLMGGAEMAASAALSRDLMVDALKTQRDEAVKALNVYQTAEKAALAKSIEAEVDALVAGKCILPAAKPRWLALAKKSPAEFRAASADLKPIALFVPHASAIAPAPGGGEALDQEKLPLTHPRVVALSTALDQMKASPESKAAALKKLTG